MQERVLTKVTENILPNQFLEITGHDPRTLLCSIGILLLDSQSF